MGERFRNQLSTRIIILEMAKGQLQNSIENFGEYNEEVLSASEKCFNAYKEYDNANTVQKRYISLVNIDSYFTTWMNSYKKMFNASSDPRKHEIINHLNSILRDHKLALEELKMIVLTEEIV